MSKLFDEALGELIKEYRLKKGLIQDDVGSALNVSYQQIQKYEKGINELKAKNNHGKVKGKSCVSWRIENYDLPKEDLVIDGEYEEVKETERITDGS